LKAKITRITIARVINKLKDSEFILDENEKVHYASHTLNNLNELDYLRKYPLSYFF